MVVDPESVLSPFKAAAAAVNQTVLIGGGIALAAVATGYVLRTSNGKIKLGSVEIPLESVALVIAGLTVAHAYFAWSLLLHSAQVLNCKVPQLAGAAWQALVGGSYLLTLDMTERAPFGFGGWSLATMGGLGDHLMLAHTALAMVTFLGVVQWRKPARWPRRTVSTVVALLLVVANWWIGSQWALLTSDLSRVRQGDATMAGSISKWVSELGGGRAECPKAK